MEAPDAEEPFKVAQYELLFCYEDDFLQVGKRT
jgi:hypothetical protein